MPPLCSRSNISAVVEGKTFGCILAPGQVKSLECRLEVSAVQAAEAKRVAAKELEGRVLAHERDRVGLETAISAAEEGEGFSVRNHASGHVIWSLHLHPFCSGFELLVG